MIGPLHPEVRRELQRARREEIVRTLKGAAGRPPGPEGSSDERR
jgi:hypothetical protein